jgi:hypothetical protein
MKILKGTEENRESQVYGNWPPGKEFNPSSMEYEAEMVKLNGYSRLILI